MSVEEPVSQVHGDAAFVVLMARQGDGDSVCAVVQEAAGVWVQLRDGSSLKVEQPRPVDISPECAAMLERLCLAQAQECTFEKARQDGKKPAILARSASF